MNEYIRHENHRARTAASFAPWKRDREEGELKSRTCQLVVLEMPTTWRRMPRPRGGPRGGGREPLHCQRDDHQRDARVVVVAPAVARGLDSEAFLVSKPLTKQQADAAVKQKGKEPYFSPMNGRPWSSRHAASTSCASALLQSIPSIVCDIPRRAQTQQNQSWS